MIQDRTSQNALSLFVGAFVFAIAGIAVLSVNGYTDSGRSALFVGTLVVITVVVVTLLHWISFLTRFGRLSDILDRVEDAATQSMRMYAEDPLNGASPWVNPVSQTFPVPYHLLLCQGFCLQNLCVQFRERSSCNGIGYLIPMCGWVCWRCLRYPAVRCPTASMIRVRRLRRWARFRGCVRSSAACVGLGRGCPRSSRVLLPGDGERSPRFGAGG